MILLVASFCYGYRSQPDWTVGSMHTESQFSIIIMEVRTSHSFSYGILSLVPAWMSCIHCSLRICQTASHQSDRVQPCHLEMLWKLMVGRWCLRGISWGRWQAFPSLSFGNSLTPWSQSFLKTEVSQWHSTQNADEISSCCCVFGQLLSAYKIHCEALPITGAS